MTQQTDPEITTRVRELTDGEVAHYCEHGWVMIRSLVSPDLAAEMLEVAKSTATSMRRESRYLINGELAHARVEPFRSFAFGRQMERNAQRLCDRVRLSGSETLLRFHHERAMSKEPSSPGTLYHQDATEEGSDRIGQVNFWLALDEVTPEMGAMRFITGVHREGPLGIVLGETGEEPDLLGVYPRLLDTYELSPPFHYQPGDATAHQGYTPHGAPPNTTNRARWSYIFGYIPADTRYINGNAIRPGIDRHTANDEDYPIIGAC